MRLPKVSRKVSWPAALLAVAGAAVVVGGVLLGDGQLVGIGVALLSASGLTAGVGYSVPDSRPTVSRRARSAARRDRVAAKRAKRSR